MSFLSIDHLRPQALRTSKIRGVQLAIVVDNRDGDGNPGYRVKLKFPWLNEQESTFWARIAVPMGGPGRGTYVLPEIDDQVLVVFEHGDINRPIVVGSLWSKQQEPVEVNQSGKNNTKLIKSRCGHRIIFDDKEGAEKVIIVDETKRNKIILDSTNKIVQIESDGEIEIKAKTSVILHAHALHVGTEQVIVGKARALLTHSAKTFGLKASSKIVIGGGNTTINVSNAAATRVSGSGAGELGGAAEDKAKPQGPSDGGGGQDGGAGGSNARGGGPGGGDAASGGMASDSSAGMTGDRSPSPSSRLAFIELELVDTDGKPVRFARYRVTGSDGAMFSGTLDAKGRARVDGLPEGTCQVTFPDFHGDDWIAS